MRLLSPTRRLRYRKRRRSIHVLPTRTGEDWIANLCTMLVACGQVQMAQELRREQPLNYSSPSSPEANPSKPAQDAIRKPTNARSRSLLEEGESRFVPSTSGQENALRHYCTLWRGSTDTFFRITYQRVVTTELFTAIRDLAADARSRAVLMIGARRGQAATEVFLAGIRENQNRPGAGPRRPVEAKTRCNRAAARCTVPGTVVMSRR